MDTIPPITLAAATAALRAPFPTGVEQYRVGPTWEQDGARWTRPLAYIDARAVFARLDEAVGPDNWASDIERLAPGVYVCRLTVCGITRADVGQAGDNEGEKEKSGVSDAIKRAAVQFGVGAYLYERDLPPVRLERRGNDWVLPRGWRPPPAHATSPSATPSSSSPRTAPTDGSPPSSTVTTPTPPRPITTRQLDTIRDLVARRPGGTEHLDQLLDGIPLEELTSAQASRVIEKLLDHRTRPGRRAG